MDSLVTSFSPSVMELSGDELWKNISHLAVSLQGSDAVLDKDHHRDMRQIEAFTAKSPN